MYTYMCAGYTVALLYDPCRQFIGIQCAYVIIMEGVLYVCVSIGVILYEVIDLFVVIPAVYTLLSVPNRS